MSESVGWTPDVCVYHANCDDGFGAAWAIWRRWPSCRFVPGVYGRPLDLSPDDIRGGRVLFVDFSLGRHELGAMASEVAESVFVIDHHATAEEELRPLSLWDWTLGLEDDEWPFPLSVAAWFERLAERRAPPVLAWFRSDMSGASMAWRFAHLDVGTPVMIDLIEDRDLWRYRYGETTRRHHAALGTYPREFPVWEELSGRTSELIAEGEHVLRANREYVRSIVGEAYDSLVGGYIVPTVNCPPQFASDACHELLLRVPDAPFAASWSRMGDGTIKWSLRSEDSRTDVSRVARVLGGGGHRNAAGFSEPLP